MKSPIIFRVFKDNQIQFVKQFVDKDQIVIGQSAPSDAGSQIDISLDSSEVSAIHCLIEKRGTEYYVCDLGSAREHLRMVPRWSTLKLVPAMKFK